MKSSPWTCFRKPLTSNASPPSASTVARHDCLELPHPLVIASPHSLVGTGRADFHFLTRYLVKKIRPIPAIDQFPFLVEPADRRRKKIHVLWIVSAEGFCDLRVAADRVLTEGQAVIADDRCDYLQFCLQTHAFTRTRRVGWQNPGRNERHFLRGCLLA